MKIAIVAKKDLRIPNMQSYIPTYTSEIVTIDDMNVNFDIVQLCKKYGFQMTVFYKNENRYSTGAWIIRNMEISDYADELVAFYNGDSREIEHMVECFKRNNKLIRFVNV